MHGQQLNQIANGREGFARPNDNGNHGQGVDTWPFISTREKNIYLNPPSLGRDLFRDWNTKHQKIVDTKDE